jgi:hypothetical protein
MFLALLAVALILGLLAGTAIAGPIGGAVGALIALSIAVATVLFMRSVGAFEAGFPFTSLRVGFLCPKRHAHVDAVLHRDPDTHRFSDVESCSAFEDPHAVTCKKLCLDSLSDGEVGFEEEV